MPRRPKLADSDRLLRAAHGGRPAIEESSQKAGAADGFFVVRLGVRVRACGWDGAGGWAELKSRRRCVIAIAVGYADHSLLEFLFFALFGTLLAPVLPAVERALQMEPVILHGFFDDPEADGRGEVEAGKGKRGGHQPGALDVEVADQKPGHEAAKYAFHGDHVHPAPMPGREAKGCGQKGEGEQRSHPAQQRRAAGAGAHPGVADAAEPQGQEEGREAKCLEEEIAEIRTEGANPVVHGICAGGIADGGRVQRGISGVVGGEREKNEERDQQQHKPQEQVQGAASRWRENNANGLHDGALYPLGPPH